MPLRALCLVLLAGSLGCSREHGDKHDQQRSPVSFVVNKITAGDTYRGSLDVSVRNTGSVEIGCYRLKVTYRDASGATLRVREGASKGEDFERMSVSGGMTICGPGETCTFDVKGLTIPPETASASVEAMVLKGVNATRTGCTDDAFFDVTTQTTK